MISIKHCLSVNEVAMLLFYITDIEIDAIISSLHYIPREMLSLMTGVKHYMPEHHVGLLPA